MHGKIADTEAVVAEWAEAPDLEAVRAMYEDLLRFSHERIEQALTPGELKGALTRP